MEIDAKLHQNDRTSQKDTLSASGSRRRSSYSRVMSTQSVKRLFPTMSATSGVSLKFELVCKHNEVEGTRIYELKNILPSKNKKPNQRGDKENSKSSDYVIQKRHKSSIAETLSKQDNSKNSQSGKLQERPVLPERKPNLRSRIEPDTPNLNMDGPKDNLNSKVIGEDDDPPQEPEPTPTHQKQSSGPGQDINTCTTNPQRPEPHQQEQPAEPATPQMQPQEQFFRDPPEVPPNSRASSPPRQPAEAELIQRTLDFTGTAVTIDLTLDDDLASELAVDTHQPPTDEAVGPQRIESKETRVVGTESEAETSRDRLNNLVGTGSSHRVIAKLEPAERIEGNGYIEASTHSKGLSKVRKSAESKVSADRLLRKRDIKEDESVLDGSCVRIPDPRPFAGTHKRFLSSLDKGLEAIVQLLSRQVEALVDNLINSSKVSFLTRQSLKRLSQQMQNTYEGRGAANPAKVGERRELMSSKISRIGKHIRVLSRIIENLPGELGIRTRGRIVEVGLELEEILKEHKRAFSSRSAGKSPDAPASRIRPSREGGWSSRRNTHEFGLSERTGAVSRLGYSSKHALFRILPIPPVDESFVRAGWIKEREFHQKKAAAAELPLQLLVSSPQTALEEKLEELAASVARDVVNTFEAPQSGTVPGDFCGFWDNSHTVSVVEPEISNIAAEGESVMLDKEHARVEKAVSIISRWWRKLKCASCSTQFTNNSLELELPALRQARATELKVHSFFGLDEKSEYSGSEIKIGSNKSIASQSKGNPGSQSTQDGSSAVRSQISSEDGEASFLTRISSTKINKSFDLRLPLEYLPFFFNRLKGMELKHALAYWMLHGCLPATPRDSLKAPEKIEPLRKIDLQTARLEILAQPYVCTRRRPIKKDAGNSGSFEAWEEHLRRKILVDRRKLGNKAAGTNSERTLPTPIISWRANMIQVVPAATNHPFLVTLRAYFSMPYSEYTDYIKTLPSLLSHSCFQANVPCPVLPVVFENKLPLSVYKSFEEGNKHLQQVQGVLRVFGNQLPAHSTESLRTGLDDARLIDKNITSGNTIKGAGLRVKGGMLRVDSEKVELRLDFKFPVAPFSDIEDIKQRIRLSIGGTDLL